MIPMLTSWVLALTVYLVYAVTAFEYTSTATKVWFAMSFATVSIILWMVLLHHHGRNRK